MEQWNRIATLVINEGRLLSNSHAKSERERTVTDLLRHNSFAVLGHQGPFHMEAAIVEHKFLLQVSNEQGHVTAVAIPLMPLKRTIKDYSIICDNYFQAVQNADSSKVEAIDMGRKVVHNEGAEILGELLPEGVTVDFETLRKFFTLAHVLQLR
jgi:uncharacterized protein (UPF0262 family)